MARSSRTTSLTAEPFSSTRGESWDAAAMEKQGAKDGEVVLFKNFDERRAVYEGAINAEKLQEFIHR